jgi:hypothetical protein
MVFGLDFDGHLSCLRRAELASRNPQGESVGQGSLVFKHGRAAKQNSVPGFPASDTETIDGVR